MKLSPSRTRRGTLARRTSLKEIIMIAVIAGASGLVGSTLIEKLLAEPQFTQVISLVRKKQGRSHSKLQEVLTSDFTNLSSVQAELRGDTYFCTLGTTIKTAGSQEAFRKVDFDAVMEFARVAKTHKAQAFVVVTAKGASLSSKFFYSKVKGEVEAGLQKLALHRLVILRPGLLIGDRLESRRAEKIAINIVHYLGRVLPTGLFKGFATPVDTLAQRMQAEAKPAAPGLIIIEATNI